MATSVASLLKKRSHSVAIPPEVVKTRGVKVACSELMTLALYADDSAEYVYFMSSDYGYKLIGVRVKAFSRRYSSLSCDNLR